MRIATTAAATAALLILSACQVERDEANDSTTIAFNEDVAENGLEDAAATAENVAGDVANEAEQIGEAVSNEVGDVDVEVRTDGEGNAQ